MTHLTALAQFAADIVKAIAPSMVLHGLHDRGEARRHAGLLNSTHLCPRGQVSRIRLELLPLQVVVASHDGCPDGQEAFQVGIRHPEAVH